jgi:hypothetical protein
VYCQARKVLDIRTRFLAKWPHGCDFEQNPGGKNVVRLCFPLNAGEKIRGLWIRTPKPISVGEQAIIVSSNICLDAGAETEFTQIHTTRSRIRTFGLSSGLDRERYDYRSLLQGSDDFVHGIYYNALNSDRDSVTDLGVVCDPTGHGLIHVPSLPELPSFLDAPTSSREWYLSTASLHNLRALMFCHDDSDDPSPCIGMSLFSHDDTRDALGQVCLDCVVSNTSEVPRRNIRYRNLKVSIKHYVYWKVVESDKEHQDDTEGNWKSVPQHGTIRWWFGRLGNRIVID